jgi:hypothetical protein
MNNVPVGDTFLRHDDDWVRLLNSTDAFNNDNNRYNRGLAAKNLWARDNIFADGGVIWLKNGWTIDTTDGEFRVKHNGDQKFVAHTNGKGWQKAGGWLVSEDRQYELKLQDGSGQCLDMGAKDGRPYKNTCDWGNGWRVIKLNSKP